MHSLDARIACAVHVIVPPFLTLFQQQRLLYCVPKTRVCQQVIRWLGPGAMREIFSNSELLHRASIAKQRINRVRLLSG